MRHVTQTSLIPTLKDEKRYGMVTKALLLGSGDGAAERRRPRGLREAQGLEAVMKKQATDKAEARRPFTADELPPELKGRVKALVYDLSNDDLPMALLDMAHLYRALRAGSARRSEIDEPVELTEDLRTLIFNEDRAAIEEICMGPDEQGRCPRAVEGHPVDCADKWIMNKGWNFKVAPDADACPLVSLGLAHRYLRAAIAGKK
jgi:hypothetical protein